MSLKGGRSSKERLCSHQNCIVKMFERRKRKFEGNADAATFRPSCKKVYFIEQSDM